MAAELQSVEHSNAVSLLEEHRDQGRTDVTGSAGDEYSHRRLHPWWLESRLERPESLVVVTCGKTRRGDNTPGPRPCGLIRCVARGPDESRIPDRSGANLSAARSRPAGRHIRLVPPDCQRALFAIGAGRSAGSRRRAWNRSRDWSKFGPDRATQVRQENDADLRFESRDDNGPALF